MDTKTANLLRILDEVAIEILLALLEGSMTEKSLVPKIENAGQSAVHKKLGQLERAGLLRRSPDEGRRGRLWSLVAPGPTAESISSILALADALGAADAQLREGTRRRLDALDGARPSLRILEAGEAP